MVKNYILIVLAFFCFEFCFAQINTLCSAQIDYIKIENNSDIPIVSNNSDGTITLTHPDQNITDIFSNYTIYDFYHSHPNSNPNGELFKYYSIVHGNKDLITSIYDNVPSSIFLVDEYTFTAIDPNVITLLDNKTYKLKSYCSDVPENGDTCEDTTVLVPNDFELKITFNYDSSLDIIRAETINATPCGNSFSIGLKGGFNDFSGSMDNKVQLWESDLGISTESNFSDFCHYTEEMLYGLLDIGCFDGRNYGNLLIYEGLTSNQIIFQRENSIFSTDFMTFEEDNLSIDDINLAEMRPYRSSNNPYLQISNLNNKNVTVEIFNTTGQTIYKTNKFQNNSVNLSNYSQGLYFIRLSSEKNQQQKVFKFIVQ